MKSPYLKMRLLFRAFRCRSQILAQYYRDLAACFDMPMDRVPLMALDLEMTGLDATQDQILSIGLVPIENGLLQLGLARHKLIKIDGSVGDSAAIHGILDNHLEDAVSTQDAIDWFLRQTRGKVLVAHHAPLDLSFLQRAIDRCYGESIRLTAIDTMSLERKRLLRQHHVLKEGSLRLDACRRRYALPIYSAHNATVDALACGELLLAQMAAIGGARQLSLADLLG